MVTRLTKYLKTVLLSFAQFRYAIQQTDAQSARAGTGTPRRSVHAKSLGALPSCARPKRVREPM